MQKRLNMKKSIYCNVIHTYVIFHLFVGNAGKYVMRILLVVNLAEGGCRHQLGVW